jgi:hypothetical protein
MLARWSANRPVVALCAALVGLAVMTVPAAAAMSGWAKAASPNPIAPTGQLEWLTCSGPSMCMAVGTYENGSGTGLTLAERWDGHNWTQLSTPNPPGAQVSYFLAVSCSSPSVCTAVGAYFDGAGVQHALAERWNGGTWSVQSVPEPAGSESTNFEGVSCASASSCVAVGSSNDGPDFSGNQTTLAERWNGTTWSIQSTPDPGDSNILFAASCTSPSACESVGRYFDGSGDERTLAERWDGHRWSTQSTQDPGSPDALFGLSCPTSSDCTAVGKYQDSSGTNLDMAEQWNGRKWTVQSTPTPSGALFPALFAVSCSSPSACTAVGSYFNQVDDSFTGFPVTERWDGHTWKLQDAANVPGGSGGQLFGVSCTGPSTCIAAGFGNDASGTLVTLGEGWDGTQWSVQATVDPPGDRGGQLLGVDCRSQSSCVAVGQTTGGALSEIENRGGWQITPTPNPPGAAQAALNFVSCASPSFCIAVGFALDSSGNSLGTVTERWDGMRWSLQTTPTCTAADACTAVGNTPAGFLAQRWNGRSWSIQPTPMPAGAEPDQSFLTGVSCASRSACTAVGLPNDSSGTPIGTLAERWNGTTWSIQATPESTSPGFVLDAVSCASVSICIAVGNTDTGLLAEGWNGTGWTEQASVTPAGTEGNGNFFSNLDCTSPTACTAVGLVFGDAGPSTVAERWDGTTWTVQDTPSLGQPATYDIDPPAVSCPSLSACTLVGGYTNNGPKVTLVEQWNGGGGGPGPGIDSASSPNPQAAKPAESGRGKT